MLRRSGCVALFAAFLGAGLCSQSDAGFIIFTDRAAFDAVVSGGLTTDSFEDGFTTGASVTRSGFSLSESGGLTDSIMASDAAVLGFLGLGGANTDGSLAAAFSDDGSSVLNIDFTNPVNAFGVDLTSNVTGVAAIGGDTSGSVIFGAGTSSFLGVVNTTGTFSNLTLAFSGEANIAIDNVSYGNADLTTVPEPGSMALLACGVACAAANVKSRRRKNVQA